MADHPVIFACANPDPEIAYPLAMETRPDCIMGTGRTDFPNQINNLSGFPYIFRGALDVYATEINEAMKLAAARALAALAKEPVPAEVSAAYQGQTFSFGQGYVIPKPFDPASSNGCPRLSRRPRWTPASPASPLRTWTPTRPASASASRRRRAAPTR